MPYRTLNPDMIVATVEKLNGRMEARFSGRGLTQVSRELVELARDETGKARQLARPRFFLRGLSYLLVLCAIGVIGYIGWTLKLEFQAEFNLGMFEGVEAFINLLILLVAGVWFLLNLENRAKRHDVLARINQLRSIAHVIDMHQLSKDPMSDLHVGSKAETSPESDLHGYDLVRYLDYCADLLAILGKLAAVYPQYTDDAVVIGAVTDLERLSSELSRKVWQKITVLEMQGTVAQGELADVSTSDSGMSRPAEDDTADVEADPGDLPPILR